MGLLLLQILAGALVGYIYVVPQEQEETFSTEFPTFLEEPQTEFDQQVQLIAMLLAVVIDTNLAYRYGRLIMDNSKLQNVDPVLLAGIMMQESRADSMAVSSGSAIGLMQIIPSIWRIPGCDALLVTSPPQSRREHIANLHRPQINICYGARILRFYLNQQQGNVRRALWKYSGAAKLYPTRVLSYVGQAYIILHQDRYE